MRAVAPLDAHALAAIGGTGAIRASYAKFVEKGRMAADDAGGEEDVKLRVHAFLQRSCLKGTCGSGNASARGSPVMAGMCSFTDLRSAPLGAMKKPQEDHCSFLIVATNSAK